MNEANKIKEGMDVICSCGTRIGQVDRLQGDRVKFKKSDPVSDGVHLFFPVEWVERVDRNVELNMNSEDVMNAWMEESIA